MTTSNQVFNHLYHRYGADVALMFQLLRSANKSCEQALLVAICLGAQS